MSGKDKEDKKDGKESEEPKDRCTRKFCPPVRNVTHPLRYYIFTNEEIRALEDCDRESFYRRCLPISTLLATATYAGVKNGFLKRNPHFGAVPKVLLAILIGHVVGRLAYIPQCDARFRKLPEDSHLGNTMRKYREQNYPDEKDQIKQKN